MFACHHCNEQVHGQLAATHWQVGHCSCTRHRSLLEVGAQLTTTCCSGLGVKSPAIMETSAAGHGARVGPAGHRGGGYAECGVLRVAPPPHVPALRGAAAGVRAGARLVKLRDCARPPPQRSRRVACKREACSCLLSCGPLIRVAPHVAVPGVLCELVVGSCPPCSPALSLVLVACRRLLQCASPHRSHPFSADPQLAFTCTCFGMRSPARTPDCMSPLCRQSACCGASVSRRAGSSAGRARRQASAPGRTAAAASHSVGRHEARVL